jgi:tetratricopeptide (TPR) repeat protein
VPGRDAGGGPRDDEATLRWVQALKAQGWGYYRAAFTHGRELWEHALEAFRQAAALARETGNQRALVGVLSGEATVLRSTGAKEAIRRAVALYEEEIALLKTLGLEEQVPEALVNLALAYRDLATVEAAEAPVIEKGIEACREALESAKKADDPETHALAACTVGDLCLVMARLDLAEFREQHLKAAMAFYGQAEKLWEGRDADGVALARLGLSEAYIALKENLDGARDLIREVLEYYEGYSGPPVSGPVRYQMAQAKELLARLLEAEGKPGEAAEARREAQSLLKTLGFRPLEP